MKKYELTLTITNGSVVDTVQTEFKANKLDVAEAYACCQAQLLRSSIDYTQWKVTWEVKELKE